MKIAKFILFLFIVQFAGKLYAQTFTSSNLPIAIIQTNGQTIPDEPGITADMGIIFNGVGQLNYLSDPVNDYNGKIFIELRGSSSQGFPKKSYGFETRDILGNNNNVELIGMPAENDWILYGPYSDKTLMRNVLTYKLGRDLGHYAPRTRLCELLLDGEYMGLYVLMEKIKRDDNRVDIAKLNPTDTAGDQLTGGYIVKIDKYTAGGAGWTSPYTPYAGAWQTTSFQFHHPDENDLVATQTSYIENYITEFETALRSPAYQNPQIGYRKYINVQSFIDYLLINELTRNVDGYRLSTFLYKDRDSIDSQIHMGPLWDFNLGLGNANYCEGGQTDGFAFNFNNVCGGDNNQIPFWWDRLMQDTMFTGELKCRWEQLRENKLHADTIVNYMYALADTIEEAQQRNFTRWPVLGTYIWPNTFIGNTYAEELNYLRLWTMERLSWLDNNLPGTCHLPPLDVLAFTAPMISVFPNPAEDYVIVKLEGQKESISKVELLNLLGEPIDVAIDNLSTTELKISLTGSELGAGIYLIKVQTSSMQVLGAKIVKK